MNIKHKIGVSIILSALLVSQGNAVITGATLVLDNGTPVTDNTVSNTISSNGNNESILGMSHACVSTPCSNSASITVSTTGNNSEASGIQTSNFGNATTSKLFTNTGIVSVYTTSNDSNAKGIESSYSGGSYSNSGTIKVEIKDSNANAYGMHLIAETLSKFDNSGTVSSKIDSALSANAYSVYTYDDEGTLNITNTSTGKLLGNIGHGADGRAAILTNNGLVSLPHDANNLKSAKLDTFTQNSTGKLQIGLLTNGTLGGTQYSQLSTTTATFQSGSTIDVNVLSASTNQALLAGNRLNNVVTASNNLTINDKLNITDNSALLNFNYVTSDGWTNGGSGAIHLDVVKSSENNIIDNTVSGGGNQNSQNAAAALQNVYNSNPEIASAFNNLTSDQAVASAVQSTTALTPTASVGATTQISNGIAGIVTQRQNANISGGGLNSGDTMFAQKNFWFKPFGSLGSQKDKDGISGFDVKAGGFGLGLDGEYKDNQNIGFGLFYTNANVDVNNVNQKADLDVFTTLVYGNVPVIDDKTNFLYQVGYSWQKTDGSREIFTGQTATSDYTSKTASLDLKLMRDVQVTDNLLLQPMIETTYRHFTNPAYKENGAGALNLNVDKFTSKDLIVGLGTIAHYKLTEDSKIVGNVNVGYDFEGKNQTVTSAFQGAAGVKFDTNGIDNGRWSYQAGIGYELDINKTNSINVSYDYQGQGTDFSNNTVSAKYVLKF
ncbi:autotransporter family protein [Aliarcobacter cryaerophilus]|uniref:autotransporter family protein n=4 Tax=Aliarcobacter cryaerophilus TaxID=28198 RepID=UPI0020943065|nr:autotransporter outer membrane beta-barrel domain-containing protein [Aliarcobacter cryaerophilus]